MNCIFDHETRRRIRQHVASADALYFETHPDLPARIRMAVPFEAPVEIDTTYVLVLRFGANRYLRIPVDDDLARRLAFLRPSSLSREDWAA